MNTLRDMYAGHAPLAAKYDRRRRLKKKLQRIDEMVMSTQDSRTLLSERLLAEQAVGVLLLELSKADKSKAMAVIKKLNTIIGTAKKAGLKQLTSAIQTAAGDVEKQGSIGGALKSAIKKKLGVEDNPIAKIITFMSSIEQGFEALPELAKTYSPDLKDMKIGPDWADQMMKDVKSDIKRKNNLMMAVPDDKKKEFAKALLDAFKPAEDEGGFLKQVFSLFTQGGKIPYIKDTQALVKEIMEAEVDDLQEISKTLAAGTSTADLGRAMKQIAEPTSRTAPSGAPIANQEQLAQTIASRSAKEKGTDPGEAAELAKEQPKKLIQGFVDDIAAKSKVDKDKVQKILGVLLKNKKLKGGVAEGRRISLTMDDVVDAQMALLESRGSVRRWARILLSEEGKNIDQLLSAMKDRTSPEAVLRALTANADSFKALGDQEKKQIIDKVSASGGREGKAVADFKDELKTGLPAALDDAGKSGGKEGGAEKAQAAAEKIADQSEELKKKVEELTKGKQLSDAKVAATFKTIIKMLKAQQGELAAYSPGRAKKLGGEISKLESAEPGYFTLNNAIDLNDKLAGQIAMDLKDEKYNSKLSGDKLNNQIDAMRRAQEELGRLRDNLESEKGELEGKLKGKEREVSTLTQGLMRNEKLLKKLADKLGVDSGKLVDMATHDNEAELESFITQLFEKRPKIADAALKAVESSPSSGDGKHAKLLKSIENDIKDLGTGEVSAVLDAIPSWMLAESRRRNTLAERVKLRRRDVM